MQLAATHQHDVPALLDPVVTLASSKGRRATQEDSAETLTLQRSWGHRLQAFGLSDGVGTCPRGADASRMGLRSALAELLQRSNTVNTDPNDVLTGAAEAAHSKVRSIEAGASGSPAATLLLALLDGDQLHLAWLGDSPALFVREDAVLPLTHPHVDETDALTRFLGQPLAVEPDLTSIRLQPGDTVLLLSDGVSKMLDEDNLRMLCRETPSDTLADALVDDALRLGSSDNCTAITIAVPGAASTEADDHSRPVLPAASALPTRRFVIEATLRELACSELL